MTPTNNTRKPAHIHPARVERMRAMDHLITAKLTPRGYSEALIQATIKVARSLYIHHYSAFRSMELAVAMAERLQLTRTPVNPGPQAA